LSNPCKISTSLGLHHLHQDFSFRLCPLGLESAAGLRTTKIFPVRPLGFGAEFSLHRTRSILPPKPSVSCPWAVSRSSFLCSQFGCQCCLYLNLLSAPKSCAGLVLPDHRLAVLHLVLLACAMRVFHFLLLSPEPALKFSLSPTSDVCFLLVIFLL
jgi:hypothetical protein